MDTWLDGGWASAAHADLVTNFLPGKEFWKWMNRIGGRIHLGNIFWAPPKGPVFPRQLTAQTPAHSPSAAWHGSSFYSSARSLQSWAQRGLWTFGQPRRSDAQMSICFGDSVTKARKPSSVLCSSSEVPRYLCVCLPPPSPHSTLGDEIQGQTIKDGSSWGTRLSPGPCCPQAGAEAGWGSQPGAPGGPLTTQSDVPRGGALGQLISAPRLESWLSGHWAAGSEAESALQRRRAPLPVMVTILRGLTLWQSNFWHPRVIVSGPSSVLWLTLAGEAGSGHAGNQAVSPGSAEGTSPSLSSDGSRWTCAEYKCDVLPEGHISLSHSLWGLLGPEPPSILARLTCVPLPANATLP